MTLRLDVLVARMQPGEVWSGKILHQILHRHQPVVNVGLHRIGHFSQVVGRDAGAHAHGDALGSVDQKVGDPYRQHLRLLFRLVIVGDEVHGLVQIL